MTNLAQAVRQTRKYAAHFHSSLDDENLHHWLISGEAISKNFLAPFPQKLSQRQFQDIQTHRKISEIKIEKAKRVAGFLSIFPTIMLVAVTGSLAIANARKDDDLDFFIVTRADTLWLTRLFVIPLIGIFFKRRKPFAIHHSRFAIRDSVCLNLWLDESALAVPENKRSLYTAHEVLQAKPLFDRGDTYAKFILANSWTSKYLANAYTATSHQFTANSNSKNNKFLLPTVNCLLSAMNFVFYKIQYSYMKSKITRETISLHTAYFHPNNYALIDLDG